MELNRFGVTLASLVLACSGSDGSSQNGTGGAGGAGGSTYTPPPGGCYPGEFEPCSCPSGLVSLRECLAGGGRGECLCDTWGPGPGEFVGGSSSNPNFTLLKVPVYDVLADPASNVFYVTLGSPAAEDADSLVALAADTGKKSWALSLGAGPSEIAVSDDATTAYVAFRQSHTFARIDLASHTKIADYPVPTGGLPQYAYDLAVVPGNPGRVLVVPSTDATQPTYGNLALTENGTLVGQPSIFMDADEVVTTSPTTAFGFDTNTTGAKLYTITVTASGYTTTVPKSPAFDAFAKRAIFDGSWLMLSSGEVIDPTTLDIVKKYGRTGPIASSPATNRVYIIATEGSYDVVVVAFDRQSGSELGKLSLEGVKGMPSRAALSKDGTLAAVIPYDWSSKESQLVLVQPSALPGAK